MNLSNMTTWQHDRILAKDREHFLAALQTLPGIVAPQAVGQSEAQIKTIVQDELDTLLADAAARIQLDIDAA